MYALSSKASCSASSDGSIAPSAWASRTADTIWREHSSTTWTARSRTGPGRVAISAATDAKKQPPGKTPSSTCRRKFSPSRRSRSSPVGAARQARSPAPRTRRAPSRSSRPGAPPWSRSGRRGRSCSSRPPRPAGRSRARRGPRRWRAGAASWRIALRLRSPSLRGLRTGWSCSACRSWVSLIA